MHIIKGFSVVLYNGQKLHFEVDVENRVHHGSITVLKEKLLDELAVKFPNDNPPCNLNFQFIN
jgi:hypothetical protein